MRLSSFAVSSVVAVTMTFGQGAFAQSATSETPASGGFGGFFDKLKEIGGAVVDNMGKRIDVNITTNGISTNVQNTESNSPAGFNATTSNSDVVYRTIDGSPSKIKNIFNESNAEEVSITKKDMGWPRVAISFEKWGPNLKCWQGHMDIWTDAKSRTSEDFEACNVRYPLVDDIGGASYPTNDGYLLAHTIISSYAPYPNTINTGEKRTAGPNPPLKTLSISIARNSPNSDIIFPLTRILVNLALYSGFVDSSVFGTGGAFGKNKLDGRLWFYKFNLQGRVN